MPHRKLQSARLIFFAMMIALVTGCTRKQGEVSSVSMILPSAQSLMKSSQHKTGDLSAMSDNGMHVILNITGDGANIYCSYDSSKGTSVGPCVFNYPSVSVDVPNGSQRLFQLMLAVDGSSGTTFSYGSDRKDIQAGTSIALTLSPLSGNGRMGHIGGRYVGTGTPASPSGTLQVRYKPGSDPSMILVEQEMYSGWFQSFAFGGIAVSYEINGTQLFGKTMTLEEFDALPSRPSPPSGISDDVSVVQESGNANFEYIYGWFGAGTNSSTQMTTASSCSVNEFNTCIHNDTSSGHSSFSGPFKKGGSGYYTVTHSTNDTMALSLLPNAETGFEKVKLIHVPSMTDPNMFKKYFIDDGLWDCAQLAIDYPTGALEATPASSTVSFTLTGTVDTTGAYFACPVKNGALLRSALAYPEALNSYGHDGYQGPYLHLQLSGSQSSSDPNQDVATVLAGMCYNVTAGSYEGHGQSIAVPSETILTMDTPAQGGFYTDAGCGTVASPAQITISGGGLSSGATSLYYKPATAGTTQLTFTQTGSQSATPAQQLNVQKPVLKIGGTEYLSAADCAPFSAGISFPSGMTASWMGSGSLNFNVTAASGLTLYTDPTCTTPGGSSQYITTMNSVSPTFYVKKTGAGNLNLTLSDPSGHTGEFDLVNFTVKDRSSKPPSKVKVTFPGVTAVTPGRCYSAKLTLYNDDDQETLTFTDRTITIKSPVGGFFAGNDFCADAPKDQFTFPAGTSSMIINFDPYAAGALAFSLTGLAGISDMAITAPSITAVTLPSNSSSPYLVVATKPSFPNALIGTHQFDPTDGTTPPSFLLSYPSGSTPSCSKYDPFGNPVGSCSISNNKLVWNSSDAVSGVIFELSLNGAMLRLDPRLMYGSRFRVAQCGFIYRVDSGATQDASTVTTHSSANNDIACLGPGVSINLNQQIVIGNFNSGIVGWYSDDPLLRTPLVWTTSSDPTAMTMTGTGTYQDVIVANLTINSLAAGKRGFLMPSTSGGDTGTLRLSSLSFQSNGGGTDGVVKMSCNSSSYNLDIYDLSIKTNVSSAETTSVGFYLQGFSGTSIKLDKAAFENAGTAPSNPPIFIKIDPNGNGAIPNLSVDRAVFQGAGYPVMMTGTTPSSIAGITLSRSAIFAQSVTTGSLFRVGSHVFNMNDSMVISGSSSPLISVDDSGGSTPAEVSLVRNSIRQKEDASVISSHIVQGSTFNIKMIANAFIRSNNGGNSMPFYTGTYDSGPSSISFNYTMASGQDLSAYNGLNRICSDNASRGWSAITVSGTATPTWVGSIPTATLSAILSDIGPSMCSSL